MLLRCWDPWERYYVTCCYAAEISGIFYYVTCCYAAQILGIVYYVTCCYAAEISGIVYYVTCCYAAKISGIVYYVTCCYAAKILAAAGKIDSLWNLAKKIVPSNLQTKAGQNKDVMLYLRCWQWRYECHNGNLLSKTASTLMDRWADEECEKRSAHPRLMHMMFTWIC